MCARFVAQLCLTLLQPHGLYQAPLSMRFSSQEYWSRLPFPTPGDLPDRGTESTSLEWAGEFFTTKPPGKPTKGSAQRIRVRLIGWGCWSKQSSDYAELRAVSSKRRRYNSASVRGNLMEFRNRIWATVYIISIYPSICPQLFII